MAVLTEVGIDLYLRLDRGSDGSARITVHAVTSDAEGRRVRRFDQEITGQLSAARQTGATALLDDVEGRLRTLLGIG